MFRSFRYHDDGGVSISHALNLQMEKEKVKFKNELRQAETRIGSPTFGRSVGRCVFHIIRVTLYLWLSVAKGFSLSASSMRLIQCRTQKKKRRKDNNNNNKPFRFDGGAKLDDRKTKIYLRRCCTAEGETSQGNSTTTTATTTSRVRTTGTFIFICGNFGHEVITSDESRQPEKAKKEEKSRCANTKNQRVTAFIRHGHLLTKCIVMGWRI